MHGWLWDERKHPDTRILLHTQPLAEGMETATTSALNLQSDIKKGYKRKTGQLSDVPSATPSLQFWPWNTAEVLPADSATHELHWTVLSSASEYFKSLITTSLEYGAQADSNNPHQGFKFKISEKLESGHLEAAAAVLEAMYKQKLSASDESASEGKITHLLLMLQVGWCAEAAEFCPLSAL